MKRIKIAVLSLLAMCAMGVAASAAVAHEFRASEASKIIDKAQGRQYFDTLYGGIECNGLEATAGTSTKGAFAELNATLQYRECRGGGLNFAVSPIEYELSAQGTASILKAFTMRSSGCEMKIPAQKNLGKFTYINSGKGLKSETDVTKVRSEGAGVLCNYESEENDFAYFGESLLTLSGGGELEWE